MSRRLKTLAYAGTVAGSILIAPHAMAGTFTENIYWTNGDTAGQLAGTCSFIYPDERPLSVPRTLVVDQNTPDGTVLFEWGYGEYLSDTKIDCITSNISNNLGQLGPTSTAWSPTIAYSFANYSPNSGIHGLQTNDTGIQLKTFVRYNTACTYEGSIAYLSSYFGYTQQCPAAGTEFDIRTSTTSSGNLTYHVRSYSYGGQYHFPSISASLSLRAQLIKQGTVSYSDALTLVSPSSAFHLILGPGLGSYTAITDLLSGSGIRIVPPACQLKTADYTIPMGRWAADALTHLGTPAYGSQTPVNLSLECSGQLNHVRFRFEDTGTSLSGNRNISLYDSAGGNKIEGLEIELLYNGTKVNVDNTTLTDTGSHGAAKTSPASLPLYDSVSTAAFQARYVQSAAVTHSGANYTGPVTGKVNMYVTYD